MHDKETIHLLQGLLIAALTILNSQSTFHIHINIVGHIFCIYQNSPTVNSSPQLKLQYCDDMVNTSQSSDPSMQPPSHPSP